MGSLTFDSTCKNVIHWSFLHSSFWPSADVKPMPNDVVYDIPWAVHVLSLHVCDIISMA